MEIRGGPTPMKSYLSYVIFAVTALSLTNLQADDSIQSQEVEASNFKPAPSIKSESFFQNFTAKVRGKKVRMRLHADLESYVVQEVNKDELFVVVGEKNGFWAVEPPENTKAYVFRSFILDNVVEGNRVNVRLEPDLEAPVIAHLNSGEHIQGTPSEINSKWLEIAPPSNTCFYIAKEFLDKVGGPEFKKQMAKRKKNVDQLLESTNLLAKSELLKPFEQMDIDRLSQSYRAIAQDYNDFPEYVLKANEALAYLQDTYIQKKIAFLESKANLAPAQEQNASLEEAIAFSEPEAQSDGKATEKMKMWEPVEEAIFLSSAFVNQSKDLQEYYEIQKTSAVPLTGILEAYNDPVKRKPGNYILRQNDVPVAYLYSTKVNLERFLGKKISLQASPRDNNNFAFPAFFVLSVD